MRIGFTGTSRGLNPWQKAGLLDFFSSLKIRLREQGITEIEFHHGDCIGADDEAATIVAGIGGFTIVAHPGFPKGKPDNTQFRAFNPHSNLVLESKEFIVRDHDIVNATDSMIAGPHSEQELVRSGTWTTVRYARKKNRPVTMCWPERRMETLRLPFPL